jgi:hypothetical protein
MPRRLVLALVVALLAPALAACGSDEKTAKDSGLSGGVLSAKDLALVADKTTDKGSFRLSLAQTMSLGDQGTIPATATGAFDTATKRGEMTMSMDLSNIPGGDALGGGASKQKMIFDGLTFYMSSPALSGALPGAKKWMKIDLQDIGSQLGLDFGALTQGASQDPTQALEYLKGASGDVTKVGTEDVRGEPTTHYKATIDFTKVADAAPADQRAALRKTMRQIVKLSGTKTAPMEVWVGDDGLVRRYASTIVGETAGQRTKVTQRIELYDFGTKVDVKIPPASETMDIGDLTQSLGGATLTPG